MKATVLAESYDILSITIMICLLTVAMYVSLSFLLVNIFFIILPFQVFLLY